MTFKIKTKKLKEKSPSITGYREWLKEHKLKAEDHPIEEYVYELFPNKK